MQAPTTVTLLQVFWIYLRLGCISFGGPIAHLGYFKEEFVNRRQWLSDTYYAELLGLCQFVPGPSSSQLGFVIGWNQRGLAGGFVAWLGFTLPSAILMIGLAYGIFAYGPQTETFVDGLLVAAVAVVANAVVGLGEKLCPDWPRLLLAFFTSVFVLFLPGIFSQLTAILVGAFLGFSIFKFKYAAKAPEQKIRLFPGLASPKTLVWSALGIYALFLIVSFATSADDTGALYAMNYRAGALVFGGGHVVLPLLSDSIVNGELMSEIELLTGYSAAQALPGPLFTLSAYVGTIGAPVRPQWIGGLCALVAIFLPGILLLIGLLPFWNKIRKKIWAQTGLIGANAAIVGLLLAALIDPVWAHGIQSWNDFALAVISYLCLSRLKTPAWAVVLGCGVTGIFIG